MTERFVVVGAGVMGVGIGYVAAMAGFTVEFVDVDPKQLDAAAATLDDLCAKAVQQGRIAAPEAAAARNRMVFYSDIAQMASEPDIAVEAVPERVEVKWPVLSTLAEKRPHLLASNTSSISIARLGEPLHDPGRFLGLHFFNPVWAMPLLEIVVAETTAADTVAAATALATRLGKDPIVVRDKPGFATSRLGLALGLEAIRMVEENVASPADIDKAMVLGYRHPVGPLELTDMVGLDVRLDIARTLQEAYGDRFAPPRLLVEMVAAGKLGRKSGEGFYQWPRSS